MCRGKPQHGENACIIHDGMEGLARTQCLVKGRAVGTASPMVAGTVQPRVLTGLGAKLSPWPGSDRITSMNERKEKKGFYEHLLNASTSSCNV